MGRVAVRAQPGAAKDRVVGKIGDDWKLAVKAPPVDEKANEAITTLLASLCRVAASQVELLRGASGRRKLFEIQGLENAEIERRLAAAMK